MKKLSSLLFAAGLTAALTLGSASLLGQDANNSDQGGRRNRGGGPGGPGGPGGGNFDPEQMRQRMMERVREQLAVTDDEEWKLISERIEKVTAARRDVGIMGMNMRFGGRGGGAGGGGGGGGRGGFGGEQSPEAAALQTAIENNASADDIKAKLAKYRESQKAKEEKLAKAQEELKQVLTAKQEAQAVLFGHLK
jgi:Spy/CpxP family protein refolding chaperone